LEREGKKSGEVEPGKLQYAYRSNVTWSRPNKNAVGRKVAILEGLYHTAPGLQANIVAPPKKNLGIKVKTPPRRWGSTPVAVGLNIVKIKKRKSITQGRIFQCAKRVKGRLHAVYPGSKKKWKE